MNAYILTALLKYSFMHLMMLKYKLLALASNKVLSTINTISNNKCAFHLNSYAIKPINSIELSFEVMVILYYFLFSSTVQGFLKKYFLRISTGKYFLIAPIYLLKIQNSVSHPKIVSICQLNMMRFLVYSALRIFSTKLSICDWLFEAELSLFRTFCETMQRKFQELNLNLFSE